VEYPHQTTLELKEFDTRKKVRFKIKMLQAYGRVAEERQLIGPRGTKETREKE
jgi:hypothetical protein